MAGEKPASVAVAAATAAQLRQVVAAMDEGVLTGSPTQRAYLAGAVFALDLLKGETQEPPSKAQ